MPLFRLPPIPPPDRAALTERARETVRKIGEVTKRGLDDERAVTALEELVKELKLLREALAKTPAAPKAETPKVRISGYTQFQYVDTDRSDPEVTDSFRFRRIRPAFDITIAPRVEARISIDFAQGAGTDRQQLRDAWAVFDLGRRPRSDRLFAGQIPFNLGYELERSSADRELPERSQYNRILFPTERSRGLKYRREDGPWTFQVMGANALTLNDPEQVDRAPGPGSRLVVSASARYAKGRTNASVSGLSGERPAFDANGAVSPRVPRRFVYLDGEYRLGRVTFRGEGMLGRDRVPSTTADPAKVARDLSGYHLFADYRFGARDDLSFRYEQFDPNRSAGGDLFRGYGLAYRRFLAANTLLTAAYEVFEDDARAAKGQTRFGLTTIRLQVRW